MMAPEYSFLNDPQAHFLPNHQNSSPGETAPYALKKYAVPGSNPSVPYGDIKRKRNRGSRSVALLVQSRDHPFHRYAQFFCCGNDNADIGLMRYQPIDIRHM